MTRKKLQVIFFNQRNLNTRIGIFQGKAYKIFVFRKLILIFIKFYGAQREKDGVVVA